MGYQLSTWDFKPFPGGAVVTDDANPLYSLFGGKAQYKLTIDADGSDNFTDKSFYFNPAMFKPLSIPTSFNPVSNLKGFFGSTNGISIGATSYPLTLVAAGQEENVRNYNGSFVYVSATQIIITLDFYFIYDIEDFITGLVQDNGKKFLYNKKTSATPLNNTSPSVYSGLRSMWFYFFVYETATPSTYQFFYAKPGDIQSRFYNVGDANAAPDHNITLPFTLKIGGAVSTAISSNDKTEVSFKFGGAAAAPAKVFARIYRTDAPDNSINFEDSVIKAEAEIVTNVGPAVLDRLIIAPSEKSYAGTDTTIKFTIDPALIVVGATYRIVLLIYDTVDSKYTTHISSEYTTIISAPAAIYPDLVNDGIKDYLATYGPSLKVAIQERLNSFAIFDKDSYTARVVAKYGSGSYETLIKTVTIKISDIVTAEVLYSKNLTNGVNESNPASGQVQYDHTFRVRHDELKTWENRNIKIEWILEFVYDKALTGLDEQHTDIIILEQFIYVRKYDNNFVGPSGYGEVGTSGPHYLSKCNHTPGDPLDQNPAPMTSLCNEDCLAVYFFRAYSLNCNIIGYIDQRFYGAESIKEEESFAGSGEISQQVNDILYDVPVGFGPLDGPFKFFFVDVSKLISGVQYRLSVTLKYTEPIPPSA